MKFEVFQTEVLDAIDDMADNFEPTEVNSPGQWLAELIKALGYDDSVVCNFLDALD